MKIRAIGLLALTLLAAGCAFEQQDDAVANAPGTPSGGATTGGGSQTPSTGQGDPGVKVGGTPNGGHPVVPSAAFEPCDPDPQPWKPNGGGCPNGPNGNATVRGPEWLTPNP